MTNSARQIFTNQTVNGNSLVFNTNGKTYIKVYGNFDGAKIRLESKLNNSNDSFSITGDEDIVTKDDTFYICYTPNVSFRLALYDAGLSTNINAFVTV